MLYGLQLKFQEHEPSKITLTVAWQFCYLLERYVNKQLHAKNTFQDDGQHVIPMNPTVTLIYSIRENNY
jgi:hypothetical protein